MKAAPVKIDFRWLDVPVDREPVAGMSESLAEGLVTRFVEHWRARNAETFDRHRPPRTHKRAAYYRQLREWVLRTVPEELRILVISEGCQSGLDKRATFAVFHWEPDADGKRLKAMLAWATGRGNVGGHALLQVTHHALVRLFQRLKTSDAALVLSEASRAIESYQCASDLHEMLGLPEILVPTPHGAMVIARNDKFDDGPAVCAKTWISAARMDARRRQAVGDARTENGFVLTADGELVVLSSARLAGQRSHQAVFECIRSQMGGRRIPAAPSQWSRSP